MKWYYQESSDGVLSIRVKSVNSPVDGDQLIMDQPLLDGRKTYNKSTKEVIWWKKETPDSDIWIEDSAKRRKAIKDKEYKPKKV